MRFACDDVAFFSAAMQSFFFFFFSFPLRFDVKENLRDWSAYFLSIFKNLLLFKNCQKRSSDLIMKWTRLLHHAFVLHIVVSQRLEETFSAFCWNLRGCWGAHQNRFLVNFLTHSLPRCFCCLLRERFLYTFWASSSIHCTVGIA
jgi:hypothetical protein